MGTLCTWGKKEGSKMASWEGEDEDDVVKASVATNEWDDEDVDDDDVKDDWDASSSDEEEKKKIAAAEVKAKKKKLLEAKIKEKEEKLRKEEEERKRLEEANRELSAEEKRKMQEQSDLEMAMTAFGDLGNSNPVDPGQQTFPAPLPGEKTIDNFIPTTKEDFNEFSKMLVKKFSTLEKKKDYPSFLENFFRDCCAGMEAEDVKKISTALNAVAVAAQKQKQALKAKTKPAKKASLKPSKGNSNYDMDYDDSYGNEYDDFM